MASNWTVCGVCDFRNIQKTSVVWCSECDEGLCDECKEHHSAVKSSRNHRVIPVTEYKKLPLNVLEITQTCQKHKEQYQIFCKKHDCPCCRRCVIETHNECKDLTAIDDIIHDIKSSNAFLELERQLSELLENFKRVKSDRIKNLKNIKEERDMIAHDIEQTRNKINEYLDKIQDNLFKELDFTEENEGKKIKQLLSSIEENEREITDLQVYLTNIKQHASNLQAFLAMKHIEKQVADKEKSIEFIVRSEDMKTKTLSYVVNENVQNLTEIQNLGSIIVDSKSCEVVLTGNKKQQAQMTVPYTESKNIDDIKVKKVMKISLQSKVIRGCAILPNGKMMFCFEDVKKIVAFNSNGTNDFEINLDIQPFDLAYIEADNTVAVTSGAFVERIIHIIDLNSKSIKKSIKSTLFPYYGIALRQNAIVLL
ncbi:E3 ubiquitin-protein ligase TRIM71-like [Mytilus trossulus]|uniref:E3 ubiquitin-protein ligase TRIM71-like n=1 Tax=Mytilus trossulus TaxID=6551 RepID=UPI003003F580